jgi:DNA-binding MarR family transcriptional regulator
MDIRQFTKGIKCISSVVHKDIAMPQLTILLLVAQEQGISQPDLAMIMGIPQATVSRNVLKLSEKFVQNAKGDWRQTGYDLVETRPDPYETRRHAVYLTKKGKQVINALKKSIE